MITEVKQTSKHIEVPPSYIHDLHVEISKYENRFAVLMHDMTVEKDGKVFTLDKGTLVKIKLISEHASTSRITMFNYANREFLRVYTAVNIDGVVNNEVVSYEIYSEREYQQVYNIAEILGIDSPDQPLQEEVCVYSCEKMLDYLKDTFGVCKEIDNECSKLNKYYKLENIGVNGVAFGLTLILIGGLMSLANVISDTRIVAKAIVISNGIVGVITMVAAGVFSCERQDKYIKEWKRIDETTTNLVSFIENGTVNQHITKETLKLTKLVPLIERKTTICL